MYRSDDAKLVNPRPVARCGDRGAVHRAGTFYIDGIATTFRSGGADDHPRWREADFPRLHHGGVSRGCGRRAGGKWRAGWRRLRLRSTMVLGERKRQISGQ